MMAKATAPELSEHADEVQEAGVDDGDVGLEGVGVDDGGDGVGGVVEAVDELEAEGDEESDAEQDEGEDGGGVDDGEIGAEAVTDVDDANHDHDGEDDHSPFAEGGFLHLGVEEGAGGAARDASGERGAGAVDM